MPLSKLTLSADQDLIEQAKKLAAEEGTSVSAIFSRLLRAMTRSRSSVDTTGPLTEKATGLIRLPARAADDEILEAALAERYEIRK
jgi:hypothetical protein